MRYEDEEGVKLVTNRFSASSTVNIFIRSRQSPGDPVSRVMLLSPAWWWQVRARWLVQCVVSPHHWATSLLRSSVQVHQPSVLLSDSTVLTPGTPRLCTVLTSQC